MIKRTFAEVRQELARVAGSTGMPVTDARLLEVVNLAQERLSNLGEWPYQYSRLKFRQFGGVVSLPSEYEAIVHASVDREPIGLQPSWYEFIEFGPGPQDKKAWVNVGIDLGETPAYQQPGPQGAVLTVSSTSGDDSSGVVMIFGFDTAGVHHIENFALPQATGTVKFAKITQVVKPVTVGDVVVSFSDQWGNFYQAAAYRPWDTSPSFRTYRFTGIADDKSALIHAVVRRRLFPIRHDHDELFITNIGALRLGVKGIAFEDKGDLANAKASFDLAKEILADEATRYRTSHSGTPVKTTKLMAMSPRNDIY